MIKAKCAACLSVKGKRLCKIKNATLVCPRCCAEIRSSNCIGCSHFSEAERYGVMKMKNRHFQDFIAKIDPEVDDEVDYALQIVENGNSAKGEKLLTNLIKKHPDLYTVQYGMGTVLSMKGNYSESISYFDKCLAIFPYFAEAWFNKGISHKNMLDVGNMIKSLKKAIEFGDRESDFVKTAHELLSELGASIHRETGLSLDLYLQSLDEFDRSVIKMQNGNYEEALTGFQNVCSSTKNHPQSYGNLGICYSLLGKKPEALAAYDKALEIDPEYEPALANRAILLSVKDGEKMPDRLKTVYYYKEKLEEDKMRGVE